MTGELFSWTEKQKGPREKLSPDQARKQRAEARIGLGVHPFGLKLREPRGETCGSCGHCRRKEPRYFRCKLMKDTAGPGTDLRLKWPACSKWMAREPAP